MGDVGDTFNALREYRKERKAKYGIDCPGCIKNHPKRDPTRLMPGQRCKVCGFRSAATAPLPSVRLR